MRVAQKGSQLGCLGDLSPVPALVRDLPGTAAPGRLKGALYNTGGVTALGNKGSGFFARHRVGYLPPPQAPKRIHGVLVR
jgi:hypothetical protein